MKQMMTIISAAATLAMFSSCTQVAGWFGNNSDSTGGMIDSSTHAAFARDESITAANAYSDLFLDSNKVESFIQNQKLADSSAMQLRNFYRVRNYQYAWFATDGPTEQARGLWSLYAAKKESTNDSMNVLKEDMDSLLQSDSITIVQNDSSFAHRELVLTQQLFQYAADHPQHINRNHLYYLVPTKKMDAMTYADSILHKQKDSSLFTTHKTYAALKQQLAKYYQIAKNGGWGTIQASSLKKGTKSPAVTALKKRLQLTGEYVGSDSSAVFSDTLAAVVKEFQIRNGLKPTGAVNDSMITILNVPVEQRIQQVLINMNRVLWEAPQTDSARIEVHIPSQMLYVYSDSGKVLEMPVIVGKDGNSTVFFRSQINQIVFNPTWNIPESIVRNEIMPKMKADASYLKKQNIEIVKQNDSLPVLKQLPGKNNPLGKIKFLFPNSHDIYLHDTPDKALFNKKDRALSHGCIRVANAAALAEYLLRDQKDWDAQKIKAAMSSGKEQTVSLGISHPVAITYLTTWIDEKGMLGFRNDVYEHDKDAMRRMFS